LGCCAAAGEAGVDDCERALMHGLLRELVECAGLVAAVGGAAFLFGPVALLVGGLAVVVLLEVLDRGPSRDD